MMMMMMGGCKRIWEVMEGMKTVVILVGVQIALAAVNIMYKLAANDGMSLRVLVAYRFLFAASFITPLAFFIERKKRPKMTWNVVGITFLCGLLGGTMCQNFLLESLALTTATFATAMVNLVPGATFILALCFRLERLELKTVEGKAKMLGTLIGIGGAMVLTFYKGIQIKLPPTNLHILNQQHTQQHATLLNAKNRVLGALAAFAACFCYSAWLILQAKLSKRYPCYYSSTALMTVWASVQCVIFALCVERDWKQWKLGWNIRLLTAAYTGIIGSGFMVIILSWCVHMKGPLYVSIFNPLLLIFVAIAGYLILDEQLYLGCVVGAVLIVIGLYGVLWGKGKEAKRKNEVIPTTTNLKDMASTC